MVRHWTGRGGHPVRTASGGYPVGIRRVYREGLLRLRRGSLQAGRMPGRQAGRVAVCLTFQTCGVFDCAGIE
jgi:hypothetical protein